MPRKPTYTEDDIRKAAIELNAAAKPVNPSAISRHLGGGDKKRIAAILAEMDRTNIHSVSEQCASSRYGQITTTSKAIALSAERQIRQSLMEVVKDIENTFEQETLRIKTDVELEVAVIEERAKIREKQIDEMKVERSELRAEITAKAKTIARLERKLSDTTSMLLVAKESERRLVDTQGERDRLATLLDTANDEKSSLAHKVKQLERRLALKSD